MRIETIIASLVVLTFWAVSEARPVTSIFTTEPAFMFTTEPAFTLGPSDADRIEVYSGMAGYKNSYWWDHANLTVAVKTATNVDPEKVAALHDAIETWRAVLADRFPIISLTNVTDTIHNPQQADIVLHFVPTAGGVQWSGKATCGVQRCGNVIVRSDPPQNSSEPGYNAVRVYKTTLHELGHALGLGHATPLNESVDLMGYGWINADPDLAPILSDCDLEGIEAVFEWAVNGEEPHHSTRPFVVCN